MRIKLSHIALVLSIIALLISLFTAVQVSQNSDAALIDALMEQNEQLQAQIDALNGGVSPESDVTVTPVPANATLSAQMWEDGKGADVTLTLDGTSEPSLLRVMLGDEVVTEVSCQSDGDQLTATVRLIAANGYSYAVVIGSEARTLASPEDPAYPELVYLADALSAYCNLVVGEWYARGGFLTLVSSYVQVQAPQFGTGGALSCTNARLVLKSGDTPIAEYPLTLEQGDGTGSYESVVNNATFKLPAMDASQQVDLWLEATLSDGQVLTHNAATWYATAGSFSMVAG